MIHNRLAGAVVALALAGAGLLLGTPASAHHNGVAVTYEQVHSCDQLAFTTAWQIPEHTVDNTVLVVRINGEVQTAAVGEPLALGPFDAPTTVEWRIWGGGERGYDNPPLANLDALLAHLDAGGDVLAPDAPGVAWHSFYVDGCVTPEAPALVPPQCDALAELVVPELDGVVYSHQSGPVNPGVHTVIAEPAEGYAFPHDPPVVAEWEFTVQAVPGCTGEPGTPGEPGAPGQPAPGGGGSADGGESLPVTGSPVQTAAAVGGGLVALGGTLAGLSWFWGRRRRASLLAE